MPGPMGTPGSRFLLRATKYDGTAHWIQPFTLQSDDGNMIVARCRARTPIFTSRGEFRSPYDSLVYFWRDRWYNVFRLARPGCSLALWYCNISTPASFSAGHLTYVDLDLDVAIRPSGDIRILDRDEFELHREKYGYPDNIARSANDAAAQVAAMAREGAFPFSEG